MPIWHTRITQFSPENALHGQQHLPTFHMLIIIIIVQNSSQHLQYIIAPHHTCNELARRCMAASYLFRPQLLVGGWGSALPCCCCCIIGDKATSLYWQTGRNDTKNARLRKNKPFRSFDCKRVSFAVVVASLNSIRHVYILSYKK